MKKIAFILLIVMALSALLIFAACTTKPTIIPDPFDEYKKAENFTYYRSMTMNSEKKLLVFGRSESLSAEQKIAAEAIQGIFARTNAKYYYYRNNYEVWTTDLTKNFGITFEDVTFAQMLDDFKTNYGNKYVLYDGRNNVESLNCASTVAGACDMIPVDVAIEDYFKAAGFEKGEDVTTMTEAKCFAKYKDMLNNDALVQINNGGFNDQMRDYGIACKYLFFWPKNMEDTSVMKFRAEVLAWAKEDSPIFGWVPNDEAIDVAIASNYGKFTIASDFCTNMSVFTCKNAFGELRFKQTNKTSNVVAEQGKHYICIMMSDGDNVQTWYNNFATNTKYMGAERGDFPMGWSIQPSLTDLAPNILNYIYKNADKNDYYVCSVSGQGYMNPQTYSDLGSFIGGLDLYMNRADLSVVQILDAGPSDKVTQMYSLVPSVKGGIYCYGMKYAEGAGSVYWANDKPFVSVRETLWAANVESMAERINKYATDPTNITGYTAINLHPWSMDYSDVKKLVSLLDDHVVVVTADDFIRLITENVPHSDVTLPYTDYSVGN